VSLDPQESMEMCHYSLDCFLLQNNDESCRVVKKHGIIALADNSSPSCRPDGDQGRLFGAVKRYWQTLPPSTAELVERMRKNRVIDAETLCYDPKEKLLPKDAERELRLSVEWAKTLGVKVDFESFWNEVGEIVRKEGRVYSQLALLRGTKA